MLVPVLGKIEYPPYAGIGFLTIDTTMDGISGLSAVDGKHLCCTACRSQQYHLHLQVKHRPHD